MDAAVEKRIGHQAVLEMWLGDLSDGAIHARTWAELETCAVYGPEAQVSTAVQGKRPDPYAECNALTLPPRCGR